MVAEVVLDAKAGAEEVEGFSKQIYFALNPPWKWVDVLLGQLQCGGCTPLHQTANTKHS